MSVREAVFGGYRRVVRAFTGTGVGAWPPVRAAHSWVMRRTKPDIVSINGRRMYTDDVDSLGLTLYGSYETFSTDLCRRHIKPGDVVLDIGANIGYYTLLFAECAGPNGRVYAFEPEPVNFGVLERNVRLNDVSCAVLERKAVADFDGALRLSVSSHNRGDHRVMDARAGREFVEVPAVRIDSYAREMRPSFIKMDIQGAEGLALRGMRDTLCRSTGVKLLMEFWPRRLAECGCGPGECLDILAQAGLEVYAVDDAAGRLAPMSRAGLLAGADDQWNLLALPAGTPAGNVPGVRHSG
jgi:FkbM family methyltransferase